MIYHADIRLELQIALIQKKRILLTMQPQELSTLLGVASNTIRGWGRTFRDFLTPSATPKKGQPRRYSRHDQRVMYLIATLKRTSMSEEMIFERLVEMRDQNWTGLPDLPPEWGEVDDTGVLEVVHSEHRARELAQVQVLQAEISRLTADLQNAQSHAKALETELDALKNEANVSSSKIHALELELSSARGEVAELKARLSAYAITGGDRPLPVALIIVVSAMAAVLVVVVVFVIARLLL